MKASVPPPADRNHQLAERYSILSACFGATGDVTLSDSAVIILYATMLGAGDMFAMITTALLPLMNGLFVLPMAWLTGKFGTRCIILRSVACAFVAYLLIAAAPFFGNAQATVLLGMLILFSFCCTGYVAGWFPMLDTFLSTERRSHYFGRMRFSWQLSAALFIFGVGLVIGQNPAVWQLQLVLLVASILFFGRFVFIAKIPAFPAPEEKPAFDFKSGLATALANKPLTGYSVYLFVLNLAAVGTIPLVTLYLKRQLGAPDNIVVLISSITLSGMLLGSLVAGKIVRWLGIKYTLLGVHIMYAVTNLSLFFIGSNLTPMTAYVAIAVLAFCYCFTAATANVASTVEMMALATPGNKAMAMAFCGSLGSTGSGLSRMVSSLILGSGMLAAEWSVGSWKFCHYQSLFLVYAVAIVFAAMLLVVVPAIFPKGEYRYSEHDLPSRK